jgi:uncharacterized protein YutE (UPF0331/DUF86 family)
MKINASADLTDLGVRLQVERVVTQVVNLAVEINAHVSSTVLGRPPADYHMGFDRMVESGWLQPDLASTLKPSVGLRNILTHEYVNTDLELVARAVPLALHDYREYLRSVASALQAAEGLSPHEPR